MRVDQALVLGDAEQRAEAALEVGVGELAGLEPAQQGERLGVAAKQLADRVGGEALALAEGRERGPDARRQHAAEVDHQAR